MPNVQETIRKLSSPFQYASGTYQRRWERRAHLKPFTLVLVYHRVTPDYPRPRARSFNIETGVPASVFEAQIRFMLKHFVPIKPSQVLEPSETKVRFAITLDDGYEDNYLVAAPILRRYGVSAAFYAVTDYVGTDRLFWWEQLAHIVRDTRAPAINLDETVPELTGHLSQSAFSIESDRDRIVTYETLSSALRAAPHNELPGYLSHLAEALEVPLRQEGRDYKLMNWNQLKELAGQGFEIGGHTATHCNLVGVAEKTLQTEVVSSIETLKNQIQSPVLTFAYPYGRFQQDDNSAVVKVLRDSGCLAAFTCVNTVMQEGDSDYEIPRSRLNRSYPFACAYNVQYALNNRPL